MQRILVVDDVELNRELLREILRDEYVIDTAEPLEKCAAVIQEILLVIIIIDIKRTFS